MFVMWKSRTYDQRLQDPTGTDKGDYNRRTERGGVKRKKFSVRDGLRDWKLKPIRMTNLYVALNHTESLDKESDHIMIKVNIHNEDQKITTNVMIDSGAIISKNKVVSGAIISKNKVVSGVATQSQELAHQSFVSGVTGAPGSKERGTTAMGDKGYLRCLAWTSELDEGTHETIEEIFVSSGTMYCHSVTPEACYPDSWSSEFKYLDD